MYRLTNGDRNDIQAKLNNLVYRGIHTCSDNPLGYDEKEVVEFTWSLLPHDVQAAYAVFSRPECNPQILFNTRGCVWFSINVDDKVVAFEADLQNYFPLPVTSPVSTINIPEDSPYYDGLVTWADTRSKHNVLKSRSVRFIDLTIDSCRTPGQLKRVWPDVVNFLDGSMLASLQEAVRQSRVPLNITCDADWLASRKEATELLALCMLTYTDDAKDRTVTYNMP